MSATVFVLAAEDEQGCGTRIRGALGCATANPSLPDEDAGLSAGFLISWMKESMKTAGLANDQFVSICALYFFMFFLNHDVMVTSGGPEKCNRGEVVADWPPTIHTAMNSETPKPGINK